MSSRESSSRIDEKYYESIAASGLAERLLVKARDDLFARFMASMVPDETTKVLDVGVSDVVDHGANVLERRYPWKHRIVACGIGEGGDFMTAFPECRYVRIAPNAPLPFSDGEFEVAASNAVLEHVGSRENQVLFIDELCRVGRKVFISIPNRYFPVEHHTSIPFLHYGDAAFGLACRLVGKSHWAQPENLILMSRSKLLSLVRPERRPTVKVSYAGILKGALSSNLVLIIDQQQAGQGSS